MKKRTISILMALCLVIGLMAGAGKTNAAAKSLKLNKTKLSLKVGGSVTLKAKTKPASLKKKVKFSSNKKKIAKVSSKGKVTALAEGTAKITAKVKGTKLKATCKVTVNAADSANSGANGANGVNTANNGATNTANNAGNNTNNGTNNGTNQGTDPNANATPEPTPDNLTYPTALSFDINTSDKNVETENGKIMCINVELGESYTFKSEIEPADTSAEAVKYKSSLEYVASVDQDGKVEGLYPGMTEISLVSKKDDSICAKMYIKVNDTTRPANSFKSYNSSIPHGQIDTITYRSDYRDNPNVQARVWKPADYDPTKEYNVMYCLHGGGADMNYWTNNCQADRILDNMQAEGLISDTLVVFPNGSIDYNANKNYPNIPSDRVPYSGMFTVAYLFTFEIINNLIPYIDEHYPVAEGPDHRAVCGLSMGGGQTYDIAFRSPEMFSYVSIFSCHPFEGDGQTVLTSKERADELNNYFKLLIFQVGANDGLSDGEKTFEKLCTRYGLNHSWVLEPGLAHEDAEWSLNLYKFLKYAFKANQ